MVLGHYQVQLLWKLYIVPVSRVKDDFTNIHKWLFVCPTSAFGNNKPLREFNTHIRMLQFNCLYTQHENIMFS